MNKLKLWNQHTSWEEAEKAWDTQAKKTAEAHPLKTLKMLPDMVGITPETAKNLKWKSFKWMVMQDHDRKVLKSVLKRPFFYGWRYLKSIFQPKSFKRDGDLFLYGIENLESFETLLKDQNNLFVLGYSYCHKPLECPSGRFTADCMNGLDNPVCQQCFIGKTLHAAENVIPVIIPTVHHIGGKIFDVAHANPGKRILFLITACEMTLEMFGDWGNMADVRGIGVRLGGRICNTMKAFELSERGIKPGLTVVLEPTQKIMMRLLHLRTVRR